MPDNRNGATQKIYVGNMDHHINPNNKEREEYFKFKDGFSHSRDNQTMIDFGNMEKNKNKYGNSMNNSYYKNSHSNHNSRPEIKSSDLEYKYAKSRNNEYYITKDKSVLLKSNNTNLVVDGELI